MALPNKPYIGNQVPNQPFHTPEEPATFDKLFGSLVPNTQLDPNPSDLGAENYAKWVRPADWLDIAIPKESEEKFVGLFAIYNTDSNFVAFSFEGNFKVNWGDGSVEYYNSGDKAQHAYHWNKVPAATATSGGYRQVVITVTPQPGNHLTYMDLGYYHDNVALDGSNFEIATPWLDIAVSMPQANSGNSVWFGVYTITLGILEKVTIVNAGGATGFYELMSYCYNLGEFNLLSAPNLEDCYDMFYQCYNLKNVNLCDLPLVYNTDYMFDYCYSLEHVELTGLSSADDFNGMFRHCKSLKSVKMSGLTTASSSLYNLVQSYVNQPNTRSLTLEDLNSLENLDDVFYGWGDLRGHLKLTGLIGLTNMDSGLGGNYNLESVELYDMENATSAIETFYSCESLKSVKLEGTQNVEETNYMFGECYALETAPMFNTSSATDMSNMFYSCYSLQNVPRYDTSSAEDMRGMLQYCSSLGEIPYFDTSSVSQMEQMFDYCYSLKTVPLLNTSNVENMSYMFTQCRSLHSVPALNVSHPDNLFGDMFNSCTALGSAPLQGAVNDISFNNCCLSRNAILNIFQGLGTTSGADIDVSDNYGANDLTPADIEIAEGKGWTVTY